ncbi:MAG: hypothetical protein E5V65_08460 [Mesorhizobium sp.]|nr:MAG: hypothetical protein E5V65_08460 [Mesorhizobium sp.]
MLEHTDFDLANARLRLYRAESALKRAEEMLNNEDCGAIVGVALCCRISSARQRVSEARSRLVKIDQSTVQ